MSERACPSVVTGSRQSSRLVFHPHKWLKDYRRLLSLPNAVIRYLLEIKRERRVCDRTAVEYSAVVHWFVFHPISWLFVFKKPCWKHRSRSVRQIIYVGAKPR